MSNGQIRTRHNSMDSTHDMHDIDCRHYDCVGNQREEGASRANSIPPPIKVIAPITYLNIVCAVLNQLQNDLEIRRSKQCCKTPRLTSLLPTVPYRGFKAMSYESNFRGVKPASPTVQTPFVWKIRLVNHHLTEELFRFCLADKARVCFDRVVSATVVRSLQAGSPRKRSS